MEPNIDPNENVAVEPSKEALTTSTEVNKLEEELKLLQQKLVNIEESLTKSKEKVSSLQNELSMEKEKNDGLNSQIQSFETVKLNLENETYELKSKIDELQKKLTEVETKVSEERSAKDAAAMQQKNLEAKVNELETQLSSAKSSQTVRKELEDEIKVLRILSSTQSQSLDMYNVLKNHQSITLRKLSMQSGMSAQACKEILAEFERNGLVKIDRAGMDDMDPKITLLN